MSNVIKEIKELELKTENSDKKYIELLYDDIKNFSFEIMRQNKQAYIKLSNA